MSTTKTTTSSNQSTNTYDPGSMGLFQQFGQSGGNALMDMLKDPLQQTGFNQRLQMGNQQAFNLAARNNSNIMNRASMFGGNQMPGFLQNQMTQSGNWLAGQQSQNFNQNLLYADQMRQMAMGQALGYRPLQTGGRSTGQQQQTTGGLGTWLPQVAGMGLSALTGGLGGGLMGMMGGGGGDAFNYSGADASNMGFNMPNSYGGATAPDLGNPSFMNNMPSPDQLGNINPFFSGTGF